MLLGGPRRWCLIGLLVVKYLRCRIYAMPKKTSKKTQTECYELRALGWAAEITAHKLTPKQVKLVLGNRGELGEDGSFGGSMEEVLRDYNCYSTNLWQSGCVPLAESNSFIVVDSSGKMVLGMPRIGRKRGEGKSERGDGEDIETNSNKGDTLLYFEESKGITAVWTLTSDTVPAVKDFVFKISSVVINGERIDYIEGVKFRGGELEREYDGEDLNGKAAYSKLI
jgi:hypothetical protein